MAFAADDAKASGLHDLVVEHLPGLLQLIDARLLLFGRERVVGENAVDLVVDAAAHTMSVPRPAMFVAIGHHAGAARFEHDLRFALVLLGVQDVMGDPFSVKELADALGVFDRGRADQNRLTALLAVLDVLDDRVELLVLGAEHLVLGVDADHLAVGWNHHRFQT